MSKINEADLKAIFMKIKDGDKSGIEELYKKYHDLVYAIVFSILKNKDNSEDVVQDIFTKIIKLDKEKFPSKGEVSWFYLVSKNETLQFLRRQKQGLDIDDMYTLESDSNEIDDIVDMDSYYRLLDGLNSIDKEIVSLKILSDFTFDKISQLLDIPIGTVQWRYYKAIHYIKLSISNFTAFIIVFSLYLNYSRKEDSLNNFTSDSGFIDDKDASSFFYDNSGMSSFSEFNSDKSYGIMSEGDISGLSNSKLINNENIFLGGLSIIFVVLTVFFTLKKKIVLKS